MNLGEYLCILFSVCVGGFLRACACVCVCLRVYVYFGMFGKQDSEANISAQNG